MYVIQKKEKCDHGIENMDFDYSPARCILCGKHSDETGYVYTEVDLLEVLDSILGERQGVPLNWG